MCNASFHFVTMYSAPAPWWDIADVCLTVAPQSEHAPPVQMLLGKTSFFASCLGSECGFLGRKKQEQLLALGAGKGCCVHSGAIGEGRDQCLASILLLFLVHGSRKDSSALNASLTWVASDFGSCKDQRQLFKFACAGMCVACGPTPLPLWRQLKATICL